MMLDVVNKEGIIDHFVSEIHIKDTYKLGEGKSPCTL